MVSILALYGAPIGCTDFPKDLFAFLVFLFFLRTQAFLGLPRVRPPLHCHLGLPM
jgi:hypothetical protein